jgi:hypothetical protein
VNIALYARGFPADDQDRIIGVVQKFLSACIVTAAAAGSVRYYSEVLNNEGLLSDVREADFKTSATSWKR